MTGKSRSFYFFERYRIASIGKLNLVARKIVFEFIAFVQIAVRNGDAVVVNDAFTCNLHLGAAARFYVERRGIAVEA